MAPYNVNTMTLTSNLGTPLDLSVVEGIQAFHKTNTEGTLPAPHQVAWRKNNAVLRDGDQVIKTNGHKRIFKKRLFDNQVTVVFKTKAGTFINMKVFKTGKVQMTGVRTLESAEECICYVKNMVGITGFPHQTRVHLMNADYDYKKAIDRESLYTKIREDHNVIVSFQPEVHPSVKIGYYVNSSGTGRCQRHVACEGKETDCCKKVTVMVFHTGKIVFTGATKTSQLDEAFDFILRVLRSI